MPRRKPDPQIYTTARDVLQIPRGRQCLVVEDSLIGVQAAVAADMHCLVTYTPSTRHEDFYGAGIGHGKLYSLPLHSASL